MVINSSQDISPKTTDDNLKMAQKEIQNQNS